MRIELQRMYRDTSTTAEGVVYNTENEKVFEFVTLELPWKDNERNISCIPEGEYLVKKMPPTKKRKYQYFWVQEVPGRDSILWHPGNYTRQILGCILPGESLIDMDNDGIIDVTNTASTLKILTALMPHKFKLTITKKEIFV
jgi:hypothetical protein